MEALLERVKIETIPNPLDTVNIRKAITAGYFYHTDRLSNTGKMVKHNQTVMIHPNSALFEDLPRWVIWLVFTIKEYMRNTVEIENKWLQK